MERRVVRRMQLMRLERVLSIAAEIARRTTGWERKKGTCPRGSRQESERGEKGGGGEAGLSEYLYAKLKRERRARTHNHRTREKKEGQSKHGGLGKEGLSDDKVNRLGEEKKLHTGEKEEKTKTKYQINPSDTDIRAKKKIFSGKDARPGKREEGVNQFLHRARKSVLRCRNRYDVHRL